MTALYFFSGSKDAKPGKGANEAGSPSDFPELVNIKDWRKVLSNFYESPIVYENKTYRTWEHAY